MTISEFNAKYKSLEHLLFAFAMKLTRNKENAKDLMQETLFRAYKNKDRFSSGTNFKAWITTIMRNNFINDYRKKKTRNQVMAPIEDLAYFIESDSSLVNGDSLVMLKELNNMIEKLPQELKKAFKLYVRGYQYKEIAEMAGVPIGTIKSRIFFARKKLKSQIKMNYNMTTFSGTAELLF